MITPVAPEEEAGGVRARAGGAPDEHRKHGAENGSRHAPGLAIAAALVIIQVISLASIAMFFGRNGYLPQPFISDKHDTFMDLFHTLYWAGDDGRYTEWNSVYPPLVFVVLDAVRWLFLGEQTFVDGFAARSAGNSVAVFFLATAVAGVVAVFFTSLYNGSSPLERLLWCIFFLLSTPFLFALERGNLIVYLPPFIALALVKRGWGRTIALAVMINIKPYCALLLLYYIFTNEFVWLLRAVAISSVIFLTTGLLCDPNFPLFFEALLGYSSGGLIYSPESVLGMDSSLTVFAYVRDWAIAGANANTTPLELEADAFAAGTLRALNMALALAALGGLLRMRGRMSAAQVIATLVVLISNASFTFGGYTLVFYATILPVLRTMKNGVLLNVLAVILLLPILDTIVIHHQDAGLQDAYLSGVTVFVSVDTGLGSVLRPIVNALILLTLTIELWGFSWFDVIRWNLVRVSVRAVFVRNER